MSWSTCYRFRFSSSAVVCLALFYIVVFNGLSLYGLIKSTYTPVSLPVNRDRLYFAYMKYDRALWKCKKPHLSQTPLPLTALASFPGSGNTWVRHILQQATGKMFNYLYTCKCQWILNYLATPITVCFKQLNLFNLVSLNDKRLYKDFHKI